jgi:hypothetical protein
LACLEGGRIGLPELKKLEFLFRIAGDGGNCDSVSIVLSDKDCRGFRDFVSSSTVAAGEATGLIFLRVFLSAGLEVCSSFSEVGRSRGFRKPLSGLLSTFVCAFEGVCCKVPVEEPLLIVDDS